MRGVARAIRTRNLAGARQFRIVPSRYPPVDLFERIADAEDLELVYEIESLTNDRLRAEAGDLYRVPKEEWVTGPGATVVMAAFTHLGRPSRFSDGSYGVYYAALDEATAIAETRFHAERFLRLTAEPPMEIDRRCYVGRIEVPLDDVRGPAFADLRDPDMSTWPRCQAFGATRRTAGAAGLLYRSARRERGECIAAFRPRAVSRPVQGRHLRYVWDGQRIANVYALSEVPDG
jgi:hypothetical protein